MKPLFIWAGGKRKMLKEYQPYLPKSFDKYCEPFLGAGAMFIWACEKNPRATFILNDSNKGIMQIYRAIRNDVTRFTDKMDVLSGEYLPLPKGETDKILEKGFDKDWAKLYDHAPCRRYFYFKLRHQHAFDYRDWHSTDEAAVLYFLMKTGFNGVWQENKNTNGRFGTPCGLLNQKGSVYDKQNVMEWHEALQQCELMCGDFTETINKIGHQSNCYVFLDPPYRGSFTQYGVDFDDAMQEKVISYLEVAKALGSYVLLSNRDMGDDFFEKRCGNNELVKFDVTYTAGRRKRTEQGFEAKKAREILMIGKPIL